MAFVYKPNCVVDAHTHNFNARFVPIKGYLTQGYGLSDGLAELMEILMNLAASDQFHTDDQGDWDDWDYDDDANDPDVIKANERLSQDDRAKRVKEAIAFLAGLYPKEGGDDNDRPRIELKSKLLKAPLDLAIEKAGPEMHQSAQRSGLNDLPTMDQILRFLYMMLLSERQITDRLYQEYPRRRNVQLAVQLLPDLDLGFKGKPVYSTYFSIDYGQVERISRQIRRTEGKMVGLMGVHPKRKPGENLSNLTQALDRGYIGAKIYPSHGEKPNGPGLRDVLVHCARNDIPVTAHCTPTGVENAPGAGLNCDPIYWKEVLDDPTEPALAKLRLCLAHAGGGLCQVRTQDPPEQRYGWFGDDDHWQRETFARGVVELCTNYENVYCDFSSLIELLAEDPNFRDADDQVFNIKERFENRLARALAENDTFRSKIMYGTDYHMPGLPGECDAYLQYFIDLFNRPPMTDLFQPDLLKQIADGFFCKNALRWLNLPDYITRHEKNHYLEPVAAARLWRLVGMVEG